jgi:hypothetical protein
VSSHLRTDQDSFELRSTLVDLVPTILAALDACGSINHTGACCTRIVGSVAAIVMPQAEPVVQIPSMPTATRALP